jgi:hypothetical protein
MLHTTGVGDLYCRPTENEDFLDYQKATTSLLFLIENTNSLKNCVEELSRKNLQTEIILNSKLTEKDGEINDIRKEFDSIRSQFRSLISVICSMEIMNR